MQYDTKKKKGYFHEMIVQIPREAEDFGTSECIASASSLREDWPDMWVLLDTTCSRRSDGVYLVRHLRDDSP